MPSIVQRGLSWRAFIRMRGQSIARTFDTESQAREWANKAEARIRDGAKRAQIVRAPSSQTVAGLFERYAAEVSPGKRGWKWEQIRLRSFCRDPEFSTQSAIFDAADLAAWRDRRLRSVTPATVNRELNLISAVFSRAIKEWRLPLRINPVRDIQRPPQPRERTRRVSDDERDAVIRELGWDGVSRPDDLMAWTGWAFLFALETAMRQGEILGMRWADVRGRSVHLQQTKNGHPRDVPLSSRAMALLWLLERGTGRVCPLETGTCGAYFREAARGAGIDDLHFHDSRHEAITRFASRLSIMELARVSGHRDTRQLLGYFNPRTEELADKLG